MVTVPIVSPGQRRGVYLWICVWGHAGICHHFSSRHSCDGCASRTGVSPIRVANQHTCEYFLGWRSQCPAAPFLSPLFKVGAVVCLLRVVPRPPSVCVDFFTNGGDSSTQGSRHLSKTLVLPEHLLDAEPLLLSEVFFLVCHLHHSTYPSYLKVGGRPTGATLFLHMQKKCPPLSGGHEVVGGAW